VVPTEGDVRREVEVHLAASHVEPVEETYTFPVANSEDLVEID
jgi:hypothetical protein